MRDQSNSELARQVAAQSIRAGLAAAAVAVTASPDRDLARLTQERDAALARAADLEDVVERLQHTVQRLHMANRKMEASLETFGTAMTDSLAAIATNCLQDASDTVQPLDLPSTATSPRSDSDLASFGQSSDVEMDEVLAAVEALPSSFLAAKKHELGGVDTAATFVTASAGRIPSPPVFGGSRIRKPHEDCKKIPPTTLGKQRNALKSRLLRKFGR